MTKNEAKKIISKKLCTDPKCVEIIGKTKDTIFFETEINFYNESLEVEENIYYKGFYCLETCSLYFIKKENNNNWDNVRQWEI